MRIPGSNLNPKCYEISKQTIMWCSQYEGKGGNIDGSEAKPQISQTQAGFQVLGHPGSPEAWLVCSVSARGGCRQPCSVILFLVLYNLSIVSFCFVLLGQGVTSPSGTVLEFTMQIRMALNLDPSASTSRRLG